MNKPELYAHARKLSLLIESVEILKDMKILSEDISVETLEDNYLGVALSLGMLVKYINN